MTNKRWLVVFLLLALACGFLLLWLTGHDRSETVVVSQNGQILYAIDLSQVEEPDTLTVNWDDGWNEIHFTNSTIWVEAANCSNQVCVAHGPLLPGGSPITCLPHHLTIYWQEGQVVS